jgi:hypothetical protein
MRDGEVSMMRGKTALIVCLGWIWAISLGCRVESRRGEAGQGTPEQGNQQPAEVESEQVRGEKLSGSEETGAISLENAGIRAHVLVPEGEAQSVGTYLVHIALPGGVRQIRENRDGTITGAWLEDLDGDGDADLIVVMTSVGSGSYPTLHFFRQERGEFVLHPLNDLSEEQRSGYMGHDIVEVKEGKLLRTFPKYLPSDPNSTPSGGTVALRYSFTDDGWLDQ